MRQGLTDRLLGAAAYPGRPPFWLVTEGLLVAGVGTALVVGAGAAAVLAGLPPHGARLAAGVAVAAVVLYLLIVRAGHVLVAAAAILGVLLVPDVSRLASETALGGAGRTQDGAVTRVAHAPARTPAHHCAGRPRDGSPAGAGPGRGCGPVVRLGDPIGMGYDPVGRVAPREVAGPGAWLRTAVEAVVLLLAFGTVCFLAVVRSYRVPSTGSLQPSGCEPAPSSS